METTMSKNINDFKRTIITCIGVPVFVITTIVILVLSPIAMIWKIDYDDDTSDKRETIT